MTDMTTSVLGSGIARVVSFEQAVALTNQNRVTYFKDTPCKYTSWANTNLIFSSSQNVFAGYTAGPLFWIFAENSIAIIGACLPPLAALRTLKRSSSPKGSSYYTKNWRGQKTNEYDHLEGPYQKAGAAEDASIRHLVASGPATNIHASDIPLQDRPQLEEGIQVNTTLSTDTNPIK